MPPSGEEIRARLTAFAARWSVYEGTERSEAQTFLNELFACYGTERSDVARFEHHQTGSGFVDLIWPRVCIIEMKAPSEARRLRMHWPQAERYWRNSANPETNTPAPEWVVLCAFRTLHIWQPGEYPNAPRLELNLIDLPDQYDALLFLAGRDPVFAGGQAQLTLDAVQHLVALYHSLRDRRAAEPDVLRDFLLQAVWCLFAEDLGQIPEHRFTSIVNGLLEDPRRSSADDLGQLFEYLNNPGGAPEHGLYAGTPYANGGLFETAARVHLLVEELQVLRLASQFDWKQVQPSIFGSLLEGGLGHDQQWRLGAHYTHEADIQKVVQPTIVEPWRERIGNLSTAREAEQARLDLLDYVVLDPACGSGNFLYVAYRELRRLEQQLKEREHELRRAAGLPDRPTLDFFPLSNVKGIEIDGFAVALARVTLWMGHKLAVDELGLAESTLPLGDLSGIQIGDALRAPWPRADAIIGNPPFHGDRNLRRILGDSYVEWLRREFGVGVKDYCVYWFRKAHDHLAQGKRAGLVGTNSISQNRARGASLQYILNAGGVITSAVSSQDWPGEAAVDVSIVNWVRDPQPRPSSVVLDGRELDEIAASLQPIDLDVSTALRLKENEGRCFYGPIPSGRGFVLSQASADALLRRTDAPYRDVVRPYLVGDDLANSPTQEPSRFIIDFGLRPLEEAMRYPAALEIVRQLVKPVRDKTRRRAYRERWWTFAEPLVAMRAAVEPLERYIAGTAQGKRIFFCWANAWTCPSNLTTVFAFADDYALGVLTSSAHGAWARAQGSTLEDRTRYTPMTSFGTFPWPHASDEQRDRIGGVARQIVELRRTLCAENEFGLTRLYNAIGEGAYTGLARLHRELDEAVATAYGWPRSIAQDAAGTNRLLLERNREIADGKRPYDPFTYLR